MRTRVRQTSSVLERACFDKQEEVVSAEESLSIFVAEKASLPSIVAGDTLHWDGSGVESWCVGPNTGSEPAPPTFIHLARPLTLSALQARRQPAPGRHARPHVTASDIFFVPPSLLLGIDWEKKAEIFTFYLDQILLRNAARDL